MASNLSRMGTRDQLPTFRESEHGAQASSSWMVEVARTWALGDRLHSAPPALVGISRYRYLSYTDAGIRVRVRFLVNIAMTLGTESCRRRKVKLQRKEVMLARGAVIGLFTNELQQELREIR
jgi:hypothetical protein